MLLFGKINVAVHKLVRFLPKILGLSSVIDESLVHQWAIWEASWLFLVDFLVSFFAKLGWIIIDFMLNVTEKVC